MKRLLIISPEYYKIGGGVSGYIRKLAPKISQYMKVDVITTTERERPAFLKQSENLFIYSYITRWDIFGFVKIINFIIREDYDFINVQYVPQLYGYNGLTFSLPLFYIVMRILRKRVFSYCHEIGLPFSFKYLQWLPYAFFNKLVYILIVLFSEKIAFPLNSWTAKSARIFFWIKNRFLFIPVFSIFNTLQITEIEKQNLKDKLNITKDEKILFFLGGLHPSKLTDYISATLDYLLKVNYKIMLLCVGYQTNKFLNILKPKQKYLKDKIITTGLLEEEQIIKLLNIADIYLCPYIDGFSTRRTSAMVGLQSGIATVSTYGVNTEHRFFKENKKSIILCKDKDEFIKSVALLIKDPNFRTGIASSGKEFYKENFSIDKIAKRYSDALLS